MAWYLGTGWTRFYTQRNPKPVWEPQKNTHPKIKNKLKMFRSVSLVNRSSAELLCSANPSARGASSAGGQGGGVLSPRRRAGGTPGAESRLALRTLSSLTRGARMRSDVVHPVTLDEPPGRVGRREAENGCPSFSAVWFAPLSKFYWSTVDLQRVHFCCATKWLSYTHTHILSHLPFPFGLIAGYWMGPAVGPCLSVLCITARIC